MSFGSSPAGRYYAAAGSPPAVRMRMLAAAAVAAPRRSRSARALARALATTAAGAFPPEERAWISRVETRRRELESRQVDVRAGIAAEAGDAPSWARGFDRPAPLWGTTMMLSIPPVWGRFLVRLVRELDPRAAIELGTAFGVSSLFCAAALDLGGRGRMLTLDAAGEWGEIAMEGFAALGLGGRVEQRLGHLDETLPGALAELGGADFAFVDAEHEGEATRRHFQTMLPALSPGAVVLLDDVWSPREMRRAWSVIRGHPRVELALGLGRMGALVLR